MKLKFFGGAKMVTGANYLLESNGEKIIFDCGLHQGSNFCEKHNFNPFEYDPKEIKAVFVTHAHIDHTGRLPKLYKDGFRGKIYSTPPTKDFARELLLDSEDILRRESEREHREPLYAASDVEEMMKLWEGIDYKKTVEVGPFKITPMNAGHILGSASYIVEAEGKTIIFSGDLGNKNPPIIKEWDPIDRPVDYCLIESAYGDRIHENQDKRREMLEDVIEETIKAGGVLMIPAFALERIQALLLQLDELIENGRIPRIPVFVDSPLAIKLTAVYKWHERYFNEEAWKMVGKDNHFFMFPGLKLTFTKEESMAIKKVPSPKIIIAGSGMSQGGRILFHERDYLSDPKSTILLVGYQSGESLGRRILDGAKTVKIMGEEVSVRCRVVNISGYSAHADQERLLEWLRSMRGTLKKIFVVQGDPDVSEKFATLVQDKFAIQAYVPSEGDEVVLE